MRNKKAKQLRRLAERMTVGKSISVTKSQYKKLKKIHKLTSGEI